MIIPAGSKQIASLQARVLIPHRCEHCGHTYGHVADLKAEGTGRSPLWLNPEGARERARNEALEGMEKLIKSNQDPVACPACHRLSAALVAALKGQARDNAITAPIFGALISLGFAWLASTPQRGVLASLLGLSIVPLLGSFFVSLYYGLKVRGVSTDMDLAKAGHKPLERVELTGEEYAQIAEAGFALLDEEPAETGDPA
ncbi:MAG TPA: hypothetical protein PLC09_10295 [Holophaga sp.]|nr:hypothetical protein [Holophaga sp.]